MSANAYLRDRSCVFEQPLSPSSQLLNEALEPMDAIDDEETLRMNEEPSNNVEEPLNNVAHNIYIQEPSTLNLLSSQVCVIVNAVLCGYYISALKSLNPSPIVYTQTDTQHRFNSK